MVNNSSNINKMNIHLSPQLTEHLNDHNIGLTYDHGQAHICGGVKPVIGIPILSYFILISNGNTFKNKR
jgi:hypothetical protein